MTDYNSLSKKMKNFISDYDSIYLLAEKKFIYETTLQDILQLTTGKYLLLVAGYGEGCIPEYGVDNIQMISHDEYNDIEELYYLYEFSDRIHILTDNPQYGSLNNYIYNGLLSEEEASIVMLK